MSRILLAVQYWEGDRVRAGALARFMADLEPVHRDDADFLFSARFDSHHDDDVVQSVARRFRTFTTVGKTKLMGYPAGSYGLWHDTVQCVRDRCASGEMPRYDCILTFEADCTPLSRDWVSRLLEAWKLEAEPEDRIAIGQLWFGPQCPYPHLNGNLLLSGKQEHLDKLAAWRPTNARTAWDVDIYPMLRRNGGTGTKAIASFYARNTHETWYKYTCGLGAAFYHGDKDGSAQAFVRYKLKGGEAPKVIGAVPAKAPSQSGVEDFACSIPDKDGLWHYPDEVPSVFQQGFPGVRLDFDNLEVRRMNPGLARVDGKLLMAYRAIHRQRDSSDIRIARLEEPGYRVVEDVPVKLPGWPDDKPSFFEDPRLIRYRDRLLLSYILAAYYPQVGCVQKLVEIDPASFEVLHEWDLSYIGGNVFRHGSREKNWTFFEGRGGTLNAIYSLAPHVVHDLTNRGRSWLNNISPVGGWQERWGPARGGTPPVKVGDDWFSFFHSSVKHPSRRRRYAAGCYTFRWDGSTYLPKKATQDPLWIASASDGFLWPAGSCNWEPIVVFPSGAVYDESRGVWTVAAGINDCFSGIFEVPHDELVKKIS